MSIASFIGKGARGAYNYGKGVVSAVGGNNAGKVRQAAGAALASQHKKHLIHLGLGAVGAGGLAGLTYIKGKNDGLNKHAGELVSAVRAFGKGVKNKAKYLSGRMTGKEEVGHMIRNLSPEANYSLGKGLRRMSGVTLGAGVVAGGMGGYALASPGRNRGLHKQASVMSSLRNGPLGKIVNKLSKESTTDKAVRVTKNQYSKIENYLKHLPEDTKKHLTKKIKIKRGHLYAAGTGLTAAGLGAGAAANHFSEGR